MLGNGEALTSDRVTAAGRPAGHWKERLIHRFGGAEALTPFIFVVAGFVALTMLFVRLPATARHSKEFDTAIVIATAVLLAGLIQVLTALVRWWSVSGERKKFNLFFGGAPMLGVVPDLSAPEITTNWSPPGSNGAHPKGTTVVPFQDLRAAIWIAELFEEFDTTFTIMPDTSFVNGTPPQRGFVAIGLGFNRLTYMMAAMSQLFEILYADTDECKDDFKLDGVKHEEPSATRDFALIVRVPVTMNQKVAPSFVCAGRTAEGTAAAGYFLKNSWRLLCAIYEKERLRFAEDALAVELVYTPGVFIQSEIRKHVFGPVNRVAPASQRAAVEPAPCAEVRAAEDPEAMVVPSTNGAG